MAALYTRDGRSARGSRKDAMHKLANEVNELLFPHLSGKVPAPRQKHNEIKT